MNDKIGRYTEDEILEHLTEGEGRGFLGRSMYDAIFDKIHALKTENEQLEQDNAELKKQVEEYKDNYNCLLKQKEQFEYIMSKQVDYQGQKKEFINYLEDKIYNIEPKGTGINYNCEYDSEEDYVMAMQEQSRLNTLKEILQKYKEIIGVSDEKK